jgi:hypothetical protein
MVFSDSKTPLYNEDGLATDMNASKGDINRTLLPRTGTARMCDMAAKSGRGPCVEYEISIIIALTTDRPLLASNLIIIHKPPTPLMKRLHY